VGQAEAVKMCEAFPDLAEASLNVEGAGVVIHAIGKSLVVGGETKASD